MALSSLVPFVLPILVGAVSPDGLGRAPIHHTVVGGQAAETCAWPTTVAIETAGGLCSGTLVHPSVVVYAAHCGTAGARVLFGEQTIAPALVPAIDHCETNPDYLGVSSQAQDFAFCVLAEPVQGVPITPPLMGCEADRVEPGAAVVIAGFGQDRPGVGAGIKRWAETEVVTAFGSTANIGTDGTSTCPGDSGGSALMRMDDGSFRAVSIVSTGVDCGSAAIHVLMRAAVPWIERTSGIDITPCHDADGRWMPGAACTGFYAEGPSTATWTDGCAALPRSGPQATCGAPYDGPVEDPDDGTETGDADETGTGTDESTTSHGEPGLDADTGDGTTSLPAAETDHSGGGCRIGDENTHPSWLLFVVIALGYPARRCYGSRRSPS